MPDLCERLGSSDNRGRRFIRVAGPAGWHRFPAGSGALVPGALFKTQQKCFHRSYTGLGFYACRYLRQPRTFAAFDSPRRPTGSNIAMAVFFPC